MIRRAVDFALRNRLLVLAVALLLFIWGVISFRRLPVEAYPDVANNYVQIITQWPGISSEQIEQQITIPIEIVVNGIPHLAAPPLGFALRPFQPDADLRRRFKQRLESRQRCWNGLRGLTLPAGVQPQMGADFSPVGQIYFFTLQSTNPAVRRDGSEVARRLGNREAIQIRS